MEYTNYHRLRALREGKRIEIDGKTVEATDEQLAPGVLYYGARNGEILDTIKHIDARGWVVPENWVHYPYDIHECEAVRIVDTADETR